MPRPPRRAAADYRLDPPQRARFGGDQPLAIDLFSGAGGISLGLHAAGFNVVFASDISGACARTYQRNFPGVEFHQGDICMLPGKRIMRSLGLARGELDLLIGGPPCQGFSILGQRQLDDPRNGLFGEFIRIAGEMRPKAIVIENVPGLATLHGGVLLEWIGRAFSELGYRIECAELLAAQYGVPQMRWRMFFVGWRADLGTQVVGFPVPTHGRLGIGDLVPNRTITREESAGFLTIREAIGDLPAVESGGVVNAYDRPPETPFQRAMRLHSGLTLHNHYAPRLSSVNLQRIEHLRPGQDWRDLPRWLLPAGMQRALRKDHTRRFRRMSWDGIARSIITRFRDPKSGEYIHPEQNRTISIREAARIQSFPDWFVFEGSYSDQYDQVGNAVPPLLAKAVALEIRRALEGTYEAAAPVKSRYKIPA
jgi:DNA (cytosine-5)-methyltransferase 1